MTKEHSWWMRPSGHRDVWLAAAACLLLAASFQIPHALKAHFGVPPAPAHPYFRPGVPYEAFSYTKQTVAPSRDMDLFADEENPASDDGAQSNLIHVEKFAMAALNRGESPRLRAPKPAAGLVRLTRSQAHDN